LKHWDEASKDPALQQLGLAQGAVEAVCMPLMMNGQVEVKEAASVDGANAWQTFWRISLPMMWATVVIISVTMVINALKAIDLVLVMSQGGPGGASRIVGFTVFWEIFNNNKAGYGSAAAIILLLLMLPLMYYQLRRSGLEAAQ